MRDEPRSLEPLLTVAEVADLLRVSTRTVYRLNTLYLLLCRTDNWVGRGSALE